MKRTPFLPKHRCANPICKHPLADHRNSFDMCRLLTCECRQYVKSLRAHAQMRAKSLGIRRSKGKSGYKARLWKIFSEVIRRRDSDPHTGLVKCISCPTVKHWKEMDCGHFVPKSLGLAVYFEERNCSSQCQKCNLALQGNQYAYALALIERHGEGIVDELKALAKTTRKISDVEYLELIALYQKKLEAI